MHDETDGTQPPAAGPGLSRRSFMYGTTAAAAGAVLLRQLPRSAQPSVAGSNPLVGSSGSFSFDQAGPTAAGTGSITVTLPSPGSTAGNLLVATIQGMTSDGNPLGQFTPPASSGWRLAKSVSGP